MSFLSSLELNGPFSYSRYWTGTSLQLRLMQGLFSNANHINLFLMIFPRMSRCRKLVPVQYRGYEKGLLLYSLQNNVSVKKNCCFGKQLTNHCHFVDQWLIMYDSSAQPIRLWHLHQYATVSSRIILICIIFSYLQAQYRIVREND